jgi:hypothetical protein
VHALVLVEAAGAIDNPAPPGNLRPPGNRPGEHEVEKQATVWCFHILVFSLVYNFTYIRSRIKFGRGPGQHRVMWCEGSRPCSVNGRPDDVAIPAFANDQRRAFPDDFHDVTIRKAVLGQWHAIPMGVVPPHDGDAPLAHLPHTQNARFLQLGFTSL